MIQLTNPTGRKTNAHVVTIGEREYFFSYETCIAYRGPVNCGKCGADAVNEFNLCDNCDNDAEKWRKVRIANSWGPTTGRHFNELSCGDFETVDQTTFDAIVNASMN